MSEVRKPHKEPWPQQFDPEHPEKGWRDAEPWRGKTQARRWPWLQRIVDWLWSVRR